MQATHLLVSEHNCSSPNITGGSEKERGVPCMRPHMTLVWVGKMGVGIGQVRLDSKVG